MRKFLVVILFLLVAGAVWGQTDSLRLGYMVRGRVVDARSGRALESVHVSTPGRSQATVTNADGAFTLKSDHPIYEVTCSYLGYRTRTQKAGEDMVIRLQQESLQLSEASIVTGDPKSIVMAALDRLWDNYCPRPELLECFYRETLQKRNRYTYVAEAVAKLYKNRYDGSIYKDAAALEKSRVLVSQRKKDTLSVKTLGGPTVAITHDPLKNPEVLFYKPDLDRYSYTLEAPVYIGDRIQFVVKMTAVVKADDYALYNATLYIDRELLTFTRIEASLDMSDRPKAIRMILVKKPLSLRFFPEEASIVLNYSLTQEGMARLQYLRSTIRFACDWKKRLFKTHYTCINELVITDLREKATPIPHQERFRRKDQLSDKAPEFEDADFWQDYNIIEPSESLEHAINRLKKGK